MSALNLTNRVRRLIDEFINQLKSVYGQGLISVVIYGSSASAEFIDQHSNVNLLVVLNSAEPVNLKKISAILGKRKFRLIHALFFTPEYIRNSTDVFPIEFLDMKENYVILWGEDVLKELVIDTKNLRFQCEQELKVKLIKLRQSYLRINKNRYLLSSLLFQTFTSVLHILRNVLRLKGKQPPYQKSAILKDAALEFSIDIQLWQKIWSAKNKQIKLSSFDIETLFVNFLKDLEKVVEVVDKL